MIEGDVALTPLPQADGRTKPRPTVLLRQMPPFDDWLVCGVSTQLHHEVVGFDETIGPTSSDFRGSGLEAASLIRLSYLAVLPVSLFLGVLGSISPERRERLLQRLATFLQSK
jgi:mRNA interferase MazF